MKQYKLKVELIKHPDGSLTTSSIWDERTQSGRFKKNAGQREDDNSEYKSIYNA